MPSTIAAGNGAITVEMSGGGSASALRYRNEALEAKTAAETAAATVTPYADQIEAIAAMLLGGRLDFSLPANSTLLGVI
jgi:hypothetical protein